MVSSPLKVMLEGYVGTWASASSRGLQVLATLDEMAALNADLQRIDFSRRTTRVKIFRLLQTLVDALLYAQRQQT